MSLNKSKGNMYSWVTHTHTHIAGKCPHECVYCSIQDMQKRFPDLPYSGPLRLKEKEFGVNYGSGKTIFVENCNDLFSFAVSDQWIERILHHCRQYPDNDYVFQTKNPRRVREFRHRFPPRFQVGCTVETNRENDLGNAPARYKRLSGMFWMEMFLTIEPIMDFDLPDFVNDIVLAGPAFVNIGADSKGHGLPEPSLDKVAALIDGLAAHGIEIREKHNLARLKVGGSKKKPNAYAVDGAVVEGP